VLGIESPYVGGNLRDWSLADIWSAAERGDMP